MKLHILALATFSIATHTLCEKDHYSDTTKEQETVDTVEPLEEPSPPKTISELIAQAFLKSQGIWPPYLHPAYLHDVTMKLKREDSDDHETVIITTDIEGTPWEFEGHPILESEKRLLKYKIIKTYIEQNKEKNWYQFKQPHTILLDGNTRVVLPPTLMIRAVRDHCFINETVCEDRKAMRVVTIFSKKEFDKITDSTQHSPSDDARVLLVSTTLTGVAAILSIIMMPNSRWI